MATEVAKLIIALEVRVTKLENGLRRSGRSVETFAKRATRAFTRVGKSFGRLVKRFSGLGVGIAAAAATFGLVQFVRSSIAAASEVETFTVRLRSLIGSQTQATAVLGKLRDVATKVAPPLRDIIEAASTLGTVSLGSATGIQKLTNQALNIAAVTGLTLVQSAQNLQRALSAGLGAADLFRERGVRALLEALTDFPNLIDAPISEVKEAFEEVFGKGGVFGDAAEQFAQTLPGAISVAGDALFNLRTAVGQALAPSVIAAIREVIIPFFNKLEELVKRNDREFREFALNGVKVLLSGLSGIASGVLAVAEAFITLKGAMTEVRLSGLRAAQATALTRQAAGPEGARVSGTGLSSFRQTPEKREAAQTVLDDAARDATRELNEALRATNAQQEALGNALRTIGTLQGQVDTFNASLANLGASSAEAANEAAIEAEKTLALLREAFAQARALFDPRAQRELEAAENRLAKIVQTRTIARIKEKDPIQASINTLKAEKAEIEGLIEAGDGFRETIEKQRDAAEQVLTKLGQTKDLDEERKQLLDRIASLNEQLTDEAERRGAESVDAGRERQAEIDRQIVELNQQKVDLQLRLRDSTAAQLPLQDQLRELDFNALSLILAKNAARKDGIKDIEAEVKNQEKLNQEIVTAIAKAKKELDDAFEDTIGASLSQTVTDALIQGALDGSLEFGQILADGAAKILKESLNEVLDDVGKEFNKLLEVAGKAIFGEAGGSGLGSAVGAAIGIAGLFASRALAGDKIDASNARIESAVTSAQKQRGIVVGPQNIAIAEVGNSIRDASVQTNSLLARGNELLEGIFEAVRTGGGVGASAADTDTLAASALGSTTGPAT